MTILSNAHVVSNPNPIPLRFVPGPVRPGWVRARYTVIESAGFKAVWVARPGGTRHDRRSMIPHKWMMPGQDFAADGTTVCEFELPLWKHAMVERALSGGPHDAA